MDDAGVVLAGAAVAIIHTADFITPIVDDPYVFGRIAAANSLSDIYAMGGTPLSAFNLVAWPNGLPPEMLVELLRGAQSLAAEANCPIIGGHTIIDKEPKYGMSVTGTVATEAIIRNVGACPGDALFLTKAIGTGVLATALKKDVLSEDEHVALLESMQTLNGAAAAAALAAGVRAMTDVTGFGVAGHLREMLLGENTLGVDLTLDALPLLPGLRKHIEAGNVPGGTGRNQKALAECLTIETTDEQATAILCDPQTSGGLAIALPPDKVDLLIAEAHSREVSLARIGTFTDTGRIRVV